MPRQKEKNNEVKIWVAGWLAEFLFQVNKYLFQSAKKQTRAADVNLSNQEMTKKETSA